MKNVLFSDNTQSALFSELKLEDEQLELLKNYLSVVLKWNKVYNLTAIKDYEQAWGLHVLDSLAALHILESEFDTINASEPISVLDVGSGAGFPGMVWAIARPLWKIHCLDAVGKKTGFIRQAGGQIGLLNTHAVHARIEDYGKQHTVVVSRAFSSLDKFFSLAEKNLSEEGYWVALKSRRVVEELEELQGFVKKNLLFHVKQYSVPTLGSTQRSLVVLEKPVCDDIRSPD